MPYSSRPRQCLCYASAVPAQGHAMQRGTIRTVCGEKSNDIPDMQGFKVNACHRNSKAMLALRQRVASARPLQCQGAPENPC
eukprot:2502240-Pyramimonas_sp.AAC.1